MLYYCIADNTSSNKNGDKPIPMVVECDQESNKDTTDFTADISLDQLNTQKEVTDEDVMHHLDVIENIELDPETFGIDQSMKEVTQSSAMEREEQEQDKEEITVIDEPSEQKWYEKKVILYIISCFFKIESLKNCIKRCCKLYKN